MPGRKFAASNAYRYGFNGKENDNDVKGEGNQQDYGMRVYDQRLGRFLSEDPITKSYPELTPYQFASNRPIDGVDLDGLERYDFRLVIDKGKTPVLSHISTEERLPTFWDWWTFGLGKPHGEKIEKQIHVSVQKDGIVTNSLQFNYFSELLDWKAGGYETGPAEPIDTRMGDQSTLVLMMMTLEQQIDMADGDIDGYAQPGSIPSKSSTSGATNKQATAANKGNSSAAETNTANTKQLQVGEYKTMAKVNAGTGLSADHIPSLGALKKYYENQLGRQLNSAETKMLRQSSLTLVYETRIHQTISRTYGGRNNQFQIIADASNLIEAIRKDIQSLTPSLLKSGYTQESINAAQQQLIKKYSAQ